MEAAMTLSVFHFEKYKSISNKQLGAILRYVNRVYPKQSPVKMKLLRKASSKYVSIESKIEF